MSEKWAQWRPKAPKLLTDPARTPHQFHLRRQRRLYALETGSAATALLVTEDAAAALRNPAIVDMLRRYTSAVVVDVWAETGGAGEREQRAWAEARRTVAAGSCAVVGYGTRKLLV